MRWGGDEFLVFLPDVPVGGAMVFAERARSQVEALFFDSVGTVTLSAGIVQVRPDEDARAAIRRADAQLYEAKRSGRNLVKMAAPVLSDVGHSGTARAIPAHGVSTDFPQFRYFSEKAKVVSHSGSNAINFDNR